LYHETAKRGNEKVRQEFVGSSHSNPALAGGGAKTIYTINCFNGFVPATAIKKCLWTLLILFSVSLSALAQRSQPPAEKEIEALLDAGQTAYEQGRYEAALQAYNKAIVLAANSPRVAATAHLRIGNVYMSEQQYDSAVTAYQRAITLNPDYAESYNHLGEALGQSRQYNRALEAFNKALALDPQLLRARYNMGITYGRLGNLKYAEFVFRILVRDHPDYGLGCDGLAVTLAKSGRAKEAISFHQRAIALNPKEPSYYYNLALSYLTLGDTGKALEQQKKLKEFAPEVANQLASVIVKRQTR
jgi:protein O-GlcNAc transferase